MSGAGGAEVAGPDPHGPDGDDVRRLASAPVSRLADLIGEVLSPIFQVPVVILAVAVHATLPNVLAGLGWFALASSFCSLLPTAALFVLVRRGVVEDRHIVRRSQRAVPLAIALGSVVIGELTLILSGAPRQVVAVVTAILAGLVVVLGVTARTKVSTHLSVAAGSASVLVIDLGLALVVPCVVAVAALAWARVRAGRHTLEQVLLGTVVGLVVTGPIYAVLAG